MHARPGLGRRAVTQTPERLESRIAALEARRPLLGDAVVDTAPAPLRDALAALRAAARLEQTHTELQATAARIADPVPRASPLQRVPFHREIVAAWQRVHAR